MRTIFGLLIIAFGIFVEISWLGICFGTVIIGILLLIFAPAILFFPFTFFLTLGLSVMNIKKYSKNYSFQYGQQNFKYNNHNYQQHNQKFYTHNTTTLDGYYKTLESKEEDSLETIKKRYRKLMKQYHYDSILSKDLIKEEISFAEEKTRKLNEAYDAIKKEKTRK